MEDTEEEQKVPAKRVGMPVLLGLALAILSGAGAFYAVYSGLILGGPVVEAEASSDQPVEKKPGKLAFVEMDPIMIALPPGDGSRHLRFRAQLEVRPDNQDEVTHLLPRVVDTLNTYLRAIEPGDLEAPAALVRLRSQMLRRIQIVTGEGMVNDLLVMEFVLT